MLWVIVVLKGEPFMCTLEQIFFKDLSEFGCIHPFLNSDQALILYC